MNRIIYILILIILTSCSTTKSLENNSISVVSLDTLNLFDQARQRNIPVAIYKPKDYKKFKNQKIIIWSHSYGQNKDRDYLTYSNLTKFLASQGYFVVSIQHELATDDVIPLTGIPQIVRHPLWECGADNIFFAINELKKTNPELDFSNITLIGHSNCGDISALFPQQHPNIVDKIITWTTEEWLYQELIIEKFIPSAPATKRQTKVYYLQEKKEKNLDLTIIKIRPYFS